MGRHLRARGITDRLAGERTDGPRRFTLSLARIGP
ncbi:hypothetical protein BJ965_007606 [Streptomyces luteogriseus]|uniref:Uncharacterized protein n=1 Tax=Streptomyces luteogriseus TaxID=68233 RepID=A0A7W7GL81_9ACTN|nr:hypothetical protein [Streptomyces luteogriseus]